TRRGPAALRRGKDQAKARPGRLCRLTRTAQYRPQPLADDLRGATTDGCRLTERALRLTAGKDGPPSASSARAETARWREASAREQSNALYPGSNPGRASSLRSSGASARQASR